MVPQNRWFIMENPIKMDDLGGNTPIFGNTHIKQRKYFPPNTFPVMMNDTLLQTCKTKGLIPQNKRIFFTAGLNGSWSLQNGWQTSKWSLHNPKLSGGWTTHFEKYACQVGPFPQVGVNIKNVWNHHPERVPLVSCHLLTSVNQLDPLLTDLGTTWWKFKFNKALWRDNSGSNSM